MSLFSVFCWSSFRMDYSFHSPRHTISTRLYHFLRHFFCINSYKILVFCRMWTLRTILYQWGKQMISHQERSLPFQHYFKTLICHKGKISWKMCISQAFVSQIKKSWKMETLLAANRKWKCGAKRKTSINVDRIFVNFCKQNRKMSMLQIKSELKAHGVWKNSALEIIRTRLQVSSTMETTFVDYCNEAKMTSVGRAT